MKTTSPISTPLALGDILADITQALPDENQRVSPHPPPSFQRLPPRDGRRLPRRQLAR